MKRILHGPNAKRQRLTALIGGVLAALFVIGAVVFLHPPAYYALKRPFVHGDIHTVAQLTEDVQYCNTHDPAQSLDIAVPRDRPFGDVPLLIYIHGGGWRYGKKESLIWKQYMPVFTTRGVAVATIGYRLSREAPYPAQNKDVACAVSYLLSHAPQYGVDRSRVSLMGDSAGGHLAAMEALNSRRADTFKSVIMLYGVSDLWQQISRYHDANATHYLGDVTQRIARSDSPIYNNLSKAPPFLIIHGTDDRVVPASESKALYDKLRASGVKATYIPVRGAGHAFIGDGDAHERLVRNQILDFASKTLYD